MAILEILTYPNPKLRKKAQPVKEITDELKKLSQEMLDTMYDSQGIGLAATQVGKSVRLVVVDCRPRELGGRYKLNDLTELEQAVTYPVVLFNPKITTRKGETTYNEGCLSVPGFYDDVQRSQYIEIEGLNQDGAPLKIQTDGLLAICLQHELDHLEGKLFIDRLSAIRSHRIKAQIKKHGYPSKEELAEARGQASGESADSTSESRVGNRGSKAGGGSLPPGGALPGGVL